jgi:hypothetical protein
VIKNISGVNRRPFFGNCVITPLYLACALSLALSLSVPQGQTESGAILLAAICWATNAQRRCYPTWHCAYRPVSHLLIVNNSSFSLSLAVLSLSLSRKNGSVNGADRQRFGPSCVLLKHVSQGRTERMRIHVINFSTTGNSLDLLET